MNTPEMHELSPELLAANDGWLRALVRRLVDDGQTDDVLQEVWGHAMRTPPRDQVAWPAWLTTIARRVAGKSARSARRRRVHEQHAATLPRPDQLDPSQLVARVEERQRVAQTVLALDEPFRTVVLLRYFENLTAEQIAGRLAIPAATVRTRLHRGHERLRASFERERGPQWRGQLALLCVPLGEAVAAPTTTRTLSAKGLALAVGVPLLLAAVAWWTGSSSWTTPAPTVPPGATTAASPGAAAAEHSQAPQSAEERVTVAGSNPPVATNTVRISGEAMDGAGRALPDAEISFVEGVLLRRNAEVQKQMPLGKADRFGHFSVDVPRQRGTLVVSEPFATLRGWQVNGQERDAVDCALIVATHVVQLSGVVVAPDGTPAADKTVDVHIQDTFGLPVATAGTRRLSVKLETSTDALGNFALADVPAFAFGDLRVGRSLATIPIPVTDRHDLRIVIGTGRPAPYRRTSEPEPTEPREQDFQIHGTVRAASQQTIAGAFVRARKVDNSVVTDDDGKFEVTGRALPNTPAIVWVAAPGYEPLQLKVWPESGAKVTKVTAQLRASQPDTPTLAMTGRVLDADNAGVADLVVALADAVPIDHGNFMTHYFERMAPSEYGAHGMTDSDGQFRIPSVLDRPYRLRVMDPATGYARTFGPFDPRQACTLRVAHDRSRPRLVVRIVDRMDRPVGDVAVTLAVVKLKTRSNSGYSSMTTTSFLGDDYAATSDGHGLCQFSDAPGGDVVITATLPGWLTQKVVLPADNRDGTTTVHLQRLVPLRVAAHGLDAHWLKLQLFDNAGNELQVHRAWRGDIYPTTHQWGFHRGHSVVAAVPESVQRAELRDLFSGELLRAMPVVVNPAGVTVLDFPQ